MRHKIKHYIHYMYVDVGPGFLLYPIEMLMLSTLYIEKLNKDIYVY